jgi:hypothetical protein
MATQILAPVSEIHVPETQNEQAVNELQKKELKAQHEQAAVADTKEPISIKEILAQLDGRFPMDEAVVDGDNLLLIPPLLPDRHVLTYFSVSSA